MSDPCLSLSVDAWEYIEQTRDMVHDLETRVQKAKDNVEMIGKLMQTWVKMPLFERKKEGKTDHVLNLDDRNDRITKRYNEIKEVGTKVHDLVKVCISAAFSLSGPLPFLTR